MNWQRVTGLVCLVGFLVAGQGLTAWAADPQAALDQAKQEVAQEKMEAAYASVDQAARAIWDRMGLGLGKVLITEEPAQGYGVYRVRPSNVFTLPQDKRLVVFLYMEPTGYKMVKQPDGTYGMGFAIDLAILDPQGKVLMSKDDVAQRRVVSHNRNREFFLYLNVTLNGPPAGKYILRITVKDLVGTQKTTAQVPIEIKG